MNTIFSVVTAVHSPHRLRWNNTARYSPTGSMTTRIRDLTAIVVFCAVGLIGTLLFVHLVADGLSVIITEMP
jgi:hypothetical protein